MADHKPRAGLSMGLAPGYSQPVYFSLTRV